MSSSSNLFNRRRVLTAIGVTGAAAASGALRTGFAWATAGPSHYDPTWASVDQHPPAPEWFQDAKFGIYYHWGTWSVPAFGSEWYPRNMWISGSAENQHHVATYGDLSTFPYHLFINGGRDRNGNFVQFAPKLKSAGGNWDPNEWAQLFFDAGAKFAGPVAEHHDGFSMWNSSVNEWNSVARGPRLDLLRLHAQLGAAAENQLWFNKLKEVLDGYQPDILWQDFDLSNVDEAQRLNFLAYYYNQAVSLNKDVVATFKDGFNNRGEVFDFERGGPAGIQT